MEYDPYRAALELREQLASDERRLAMFFGAGTSMAVGIPGILRLTEEIPKDLEEPQQKQYKTIKEELDSNANVEEILDRIRLYRELIGDSLDKEYSGIKGKEQVRNLDMEICRSIAKLVKEPPAANLKPHQIFAQWVRALHTRRHFPVELFTTNYDLLLERSLEEMGVPFFDGFVGAVQPFFAPECVEAEEGKNDLLAYPPRSWTRLWKLHGSINWRLKISEKSPSGRITRVSDSGESIGGELAIFPSREKYAESRKLPYISFQDRLRKFLSGGERLLIVIGYGFGDQHINQILLQGLKSNSRFAISALIYGVKDSKAAPKRLLPDEIIQIGGEYRNLAVYGPDKACVGGLTAPWTEPSEKRSEWPFWDEKTKQFTLGDFNEFANFLEKFIGIGPQASALPLSSEKEEAASSGEKENKS